MGSKEGATLLDTALDSSRKPPFQFPAWFWRDSVLQKAAQTLGR